MPSPVLKKPSPVKSFKQALADAKAKRLPILITYDIPVRVLQDNIRKLINAKKVIYLAISDNHSDQGLINKRYGLRYLEATLCDSFGNVIKNHLLDCDEVTHAFLNINTLTKKRDASYKQAIKNAQLHFNKKDYINAAKTLHTFAFATGSKEINAGRELFTIINKKADKAYQLLLKEITSQNKKERLKSLETFNMNWPNTDASFKAKKLCNYKKTEKPFLGHCPISPKEISYLKYRIEYNGQRYYMCCVGCLQSAKRNPATFANKLKSPSKRKALTISH